MLAAASVAACSSSSTETPTRSSAAALTQSQLGVLAQAQVTGAEDLYDVLASTVTYTSATPASSSSCGLGGGASGGPGLTFTPSAQLSSKTGIGAQSVAVPAFSFSPGGALGVLCGTYTGKLTGFSVVTASSSDTPNSLADVSAEFTASGLSLSGLTFNASFELDSGSCPAFDLNINNGTLAATLGWNSTLQALDVASVTANVNPTISNCLLGACNQLVQGNLPNVSALLESTLTTDLDEVFSCAGTQSSIQSALGAAIAYGWNLSHPVASSTAGPWVWGGGGISFVSDGAASSLQTMLTEGYAPVPHCSIGSTCHGTIQAQCTADSLSNPDPIAFYEEINGGVQRVWVTPPPSPDLVPSTTVFSLFEPAASTASSASFRACTEYPGGESCDPTWTTVTYTCANPPPVCTPIVACSNDPNYCGTMPDGCGGTVDCGTCVKGLYCEHNQCSTCDIGSCGPGYSLDLAKCVCAPQPKLCICGGVYPACRTCGSGSPP
jgi:hypothetical protein